LRFFALSAEQMADTLDLGGAERLLDVATGTGAAALACARRLPHGHVTGVDFSTGMLDQAAAKLDGQANVSLLPMDMQDLAFPDGHFDAACCAYGLFFVEDMAGALRHIASKVRPGGRVAVCAFHDDAFEPLSGHFLQRIQEYGVQVPPLSWKRIGTPDKCEALFRDAGFDEVQVRHAPVGYHLKDAGEWWEIVWNAGFRGLVDQLGESERARFREEHLAEIDALAGPDGIWFDAGALFTSGVRV